MSDDIEVTVTLTADEVRGLKQWARGPFGNDDPAAARRLADALPDPTPPRSEYPCQSVTVAAGCTAANDTGVVLVPAHSLRSGDEVEWAPGDWRAIELCDPRGPQDPYVAFRVVDDNPVRVAGCSLVAVRASGVTG